MKFTLSWLKDHLDTNSSVEDISKTLTAVGLEVEQITDRSEALKAFTVAKILSAERHPEADKLQVCKVLSDAGELQIVCGAANARAGLTVALAKEGAHIPGNGMVIKKTKIRGVESNGMLCSADELALGGVSDGIIELPDSAKVGEKVADVLGLNDPVIEIAITPNRADALGVYGIARDLAATGLGTLKALPDTSSIKGSFASPVSVSLGTTNSPYFIGAYIKGVKNAPSPDWMKKRLEAVGQRSISALVDVTNYIMLTYGRPLHVFDAKKVSGNIHVRSAKDGEKLKALDGKEYTLKDGMTVIADDRQALAIGGIMGGEESGCTEETTELFLEVAYFNPVNIAQTGRKLELLSDARYRFERGVDAAFMETGAKLALKLIKELCGGEASELVIAGSAPEFKRNIVVRADRIATLGGVSVSRNKAEEMFRALGFGFNAAGDGWHIQPPSWRADVEHEADLVEEVLRINGYDNIPTTPLPKLPVISKPALNLAQKRTHLAKRTLASRGMLEAVTWSFLPEAQAKLFGWSDAKLKLLNPISAELDTMRPSLLPNLLEAAKKNAFRGFKDVSLFEVGLQFHDITPQGQKMVAAGIRTGSVLDYTAFAEKVKFSGNTYKREDFSLSLGSIRPSAALTAKADALSVLQALGVNKCDITTNAPGWYHPGRSGALTLGGKIILGYFGEVHPGLLPQFDLDGPVVAFEIFLDALPASRAKGKARASLKVSDFQAVERDYAFIVDAKVTAADMTKAISLADKQLITDVQIFDVYTGKGVDTDKKSVAVKVTLQAMDRTLSEQDLNTVNAAIIAAALKGFGGQLRQ